MYTLTYLDPLPLSQKAPFILVSVATPSLATAMSLYGSLSAAKHNEALSPALRPRNVRLWDGAALVDFSEESVVFGHCYEADCAAIDKAAKLMKAWADDRAALYA